MGLYQCLHGVKHGGEKVELHSHVSLSLYGGEWSDIVTGELGWGAVRVVVDQLMSVWLEVVKVEEPVWTRVRRKNPLPVSGTESLSSSLQYKCCTD